MGRYPTVEFTIAIPPGGCPLHCRMCPQDKLVAVYRGPTMLSLVNFVKIVARIPDGVRVTFSGFSEPSINPNFVNMVLHAFRRHPVSVYTTGIGLTEQDVYRLAHAMPYCQWPNGGFCLHLPDVGGNTRIPPEAVGTYFQVMKWIAEANIRGLWATAVGEVSSTIAALFPKVSHVSIWSRAGNLNMDGAQSATYDGPRTCGCQEGLEHCVVLPSGDVFLCCMDFGLTHRLGNLLQQEYNEIVPAPKTAFDLCRRCENSVEVTT